jgi:hypothetical protein
MARLRKQMQRPTTVALAKPNRCSAALPRRAASRHAAARIVAHQSFLHSDAAELIDNWILSDKCDMGK